MTSEGLAQARREIAVMRRLHHPCLLPLLGASVTPQADEEHGSKYVVHMLFPLYAVRSQPAECLVVALRGEGPCILPRSPPVTLGACFNTFHTEDAHKSHSCMTRVSVMLNFLLFVRLAQSSG